jgi:hypothetical protein
MRSSNGMRLDRTHLRLLAFVGALALGHGVAHAQTFAALAAGAHETDRDLGALAAPLFARCDALVGRSRELCETNLGRAAAEIDGATLLISMPAAGRVVVGPYEPRAGGFRVTVPGFEVVRPTGGVVGTRARRRGVMRAHVLAEAFVRVPAAQARAWAARNTEERLRVRFLLRFGRPYEDASAPTPAERHAVVAEVRATQVFNESAGNVLVDSTAPRVALPDAPAALEGREPLWSSRGAREVLWDVPAGDPVLFHVRVESSGEPPAAVVPVVLCTARADTTELTRFTAESRHAQVDVLPHGPLGALVVITEERSVRGRPGRGQVIFVRWNAATAGVDVVGRWRGSNDETPPDWVRDPRAPLSDAATAPAPGAT